MSTAASEVIDDIPEQPASGVVDAGGALMVAGDTILSITAACAGIRTRMVNDQGWSLFLSLRYSSHQKNASAAGYLCRHNQFSGRRPPLHHY